MRKTIDWKVRWKTCAERLVSLLSLPAAVTAPIWVPILMGYGTLPERLLRMGIMLLLLLPGFLIVVSAAALLYAAMELLEEREKGELNDAKKY